MHLSLNLESSKRSLQPLFKDLFKSLPKLTHHLNVMSNRYESRKFNFPLSNSHNRGKALEFNRDFELYLKEIETVTHVPITSEQKSLIQSNINKHNYIKLDANETKRHRKQFGEVKNTLISEWEKHTHMKWNTYEEDKIYKGKVIRRKGQKWDAHEIILNSWGSPHEWWNITPAPHPEHQNVIHGNKSMATKIFGK